MKHVTVTADSPSRTVLAVNVRRLRKEQGLTQEQLGVKAGYPAATARNRVSQVESDRCDLTLGVVDKMAAALGVTAAGLVARRPAATRDHRDLLRRLADALGVGPASLPAGQGPGRYPPGGS